MEMQVLGGQMGQKPEIKVFDPYFWGFLLPLRNYFTIKLPQKLTFGRYSLALLRYQSFGHEIWQFLWQNIAKFGPYGQKCPFLPP